MMARLFRFIDAHIRDTIRADFDLFHRARMFVGIAWFMFLMTPVYAAMHVVAGSFGHAAIALVEGLGFLVAIAVFRMTQRLGVAVHLFILIMFGMLAHKAWFTGGLTLAGVSSLTWMLLCPLLALLLLNGRASLVWATPTALFACLVYRLGEMPALAAHQLPDDVARSVFLGDFLGLGFGLLALGQLFAVGKRDLLRLEAQRAWLATFPELNPEPLLEVDKNRKITYINPAMRALFPEIELEGSRHPFLAPLFSSSDLLQSPENDARSEVVVNGHTYEQRISRPGNGNVRIYALDITERNLHEEGLREARRRAEEVARMKDAFVTSMSHEINTPLAGIISSIDLLSDEVPPEAREFIDQIRQSGGRLQTLLQSVLFLSRLEAHHVKLSPQAFDLGELVDEILGRMESRLKAKRNAVKVTKQPEAADTTIVADREAVMFVLFHLIDNAAKFTVNGKIDLKLTLDEPCVRIDVRDTGIGIGPKFMSNLFTPFVQESQGLSRQFEGSGLGLAIVKRAIELMHGAIHISSVRWEGTTVSIRIPKKMQACPESDCASFLEERTS